MRMVLRIFGMAKILLLHIICHSIIMAETFYHDNGIIGSPEILCNADTVQLAFRTKNAFRGKVFVKGHYNNPECRVDYGKTAKDGQPIGGIKINHGQCDMDRQRMIHPEGMQLSTTLIISFHPLFITKIDRAFHIKCLYQEVSKSVQIGIEVSSIGTQTLANDYELPKCTYSIRKNEIDGPILRYAKVGDQIVHRWECNSDVYGLLVHTCYVEDGQGEKQLVVDKKGCHTDHSLLGDPTYVESLSMAYRESYVFKFADRAVVRFQCEIRLCLKENSGCSGITPPNCYDYGVDYAKDSSSFSSENTSNNNSSTIYDNDIEKKRIHRKKRSATASIQKEIIDTNLISQPLYVIDTDDYGAEEGSVLFPWTESSSITTDVCLSSVSFNALLISLTFAVVLLFSAIAITIGFKWTGTSYVMDAMSTHYPFDKSRNPSS